MSELPVVDAQKASPVRSDMRMLVLAAIAGIALGWFAGTSPASPIRPKPDRPVLRLIAKLAKIGLWALWAADPPPPQSQFRVVHARVDEDGHQVLDHSEGW